MIKLEHMLYMAKINCHMICILKWRMVCHQFLYEMPDCNGSPSNKKVDGGVVWTVIHLKFVG